jgi:hypothetical protein
MKGSPNPGASPAEPSTGAIEVQEGAAGRTGSATLPTGSIPVARMLHEREAAADIVSMLKAGLMVVGTSHPQWGPGMEYAINLIEAAYNLNSGDAQ